MPERTRRGAALAAVVLAAALCAGECALRAFPGLTAPRRVDSRTMAGLSRESWPDFYRFRAGAATQAVSSTALFTVGYRINSWGLRDIERSAAPTPGRRRVLFIGDSFTEGYGVEQDEAYPALFEAMGAGAVEGVNAGMRGMSPAFANFRLRALLEEGLAVDEVVLQVLANDFSDDEIHTRTLQVRVDPASGELRRAPFAEVHRRFRRFGRWAAAASRIEIVRLAVRQSRALAPVEPEVHVLSEALAERVGHVFAGHVEPAVEIVAEGSGRASLHLPTAPRRTLGRVEVDALWTLLRPHLLAAAPAEAPAGPEHDERVARTLAYLDAFDRLCERHGLPWRLVYQPNLPVLPSWDERVFEGWAQDAGVPFLSLREPLRAAAEPSDRAIFVPFDGHLAAEGHRVVASLLYDWIEASGRQADTPR